MKRTLGVLALFALAACGGGATAPSLPDGAANGVVRAAHETIPGEGGNALPGAVLSCAFDPRPGQGNCTVAINVEIPPISSRTTPASLVPGLHPADLQRAYALPSQNAGQTVAIVDAYDDPTAEVDLATYRATFGLPACTSLNGCFRKVNETGGRIPLPLTNDAWAQEVSLDLDMVSAACPRCSILLVEASSSSIDDLGASVDTAVRLGSKIVSNSYYAFEWPHEANEDVHYRHAGVAMTVSAGDAAETFYPAASPYVTSVGGTTFTALPAFAQAPWKFGGSGCSFYEPRPAFQRAAGCATRSTVDVAAVADPQTGVATFAAAGGGWVVAGGTSVGAPLLAGAYALSANPRGPAYAYAHSKYFTPIGPGRYGRQTGLGVPDGVLGL
ncbi:MAG: peptidase S8 [Candidatus Eremiobacteraeota bacterium]|nr:peptidase S8 [Candidatus Eremiobacteraeota bacterium]